MNAWLAVEIFMRSVDDCSNIAPSPALRAGEQIVCQGVARNRTLEAANGN